MQQLRQHMQDIQDALTQQSENIRRIELHVSLGGPYINNTNNDTLNTPDGISKEPIGTMVLANQPGRMLAMART